MMECQTSRFPNKPFLLNKNVDQQKCLKSKCSWALTFIPSLNKFENLKNLVYFVIKVKTFSEIQKPFS